MNFFSAFGDGLFELSSWVFALPEGVDEFVHVAVFEGCFFGAGGTEALAVGN